MNRIDTQKTVILVTGSGIVAEDRDRPLAYYIKTEIDKRGKGHKFKRAIVVSDLLYLCTDKLETCPTISVGGPKVNNLSRILCREIPLVLCVEYQIYIHMDVSGERKPVALIYGIDYEATYTAVSIFAQTGHLDKYLNAVWGSTAKKAPKE